MLIAVRFLLFQTTQTNLMIRHGDELTQQASGGWFVGHLRTAPCAIRRTGAIPSTAAQLCLEHRISCNYDNPGAKAIRQLGTDQRAAPARAKELTRVAIETCHSSRTIEPENSRGGQRRPPERSGRAGRRVAELEPLPGAEKKIRQYLKTCRRPRAKVGECSVTC